MIGASICAHSSCIYTVKQLCISLSTCISQCSDLITLRHPYGNASLRFYGDSWSLSVLKYSTEEATSPLTLTLLLIRSLTVEGANLSWTQNLFSSFLLRYSDLLPLKLQRTQQTQRVKMTFTAGSWRRCGDVSHLSATASSVAERWAESHSSWSNWWSATLIPLSSCSQSLCFHQLLLFCLRFFRSHLHQCDPSGWWDVRTHFIKAPNLQESTECFYGNHGNETTDFRAMILWRVNLWFDAVNTWCHRSKNERQFPSWYLQRTFSVLWFWSFNISSVYCFVLENQEIKV